jgi:hypothetical protein
MSKERIKWPAFETIDTLAPELGVDSERTRAKWRQRGVPHKYRLPLLMLAMRRGVVLTDKDMEPPHLSIPTRKAS